MRHALILICSLVGLSAAQAQTITAPPYTDAQAAAASPVQSVNAQQGAVTVPNSIRASCTVSSFDGTGSGTCTLANFTGGTAFVAMPDCGTSITTAATGYVYAAPVVTNSKATPAVNSQAAQKVLNISLGLTTIWGPSPAGTIVSVVCRGN